MECSHGPQTQGGEGACVAACFPTGMHGRSVAFGTMERKPFTPRRRYYPAPDRRSGARPRFIPIEA